MLHFLTQAVNLCIALELACVRERERAIGRLFFPSSLLVRCRLGISGGAGSGTGRLVGEINPVDSSGSVCDSLVVSTGAVKATIRNDNCRLDELKMDVERRQNLPSCPKSSS